MSSNYDSEFVQGLLGRLSDGQSREVVGAAGGGAVKAIFHGAQRLQSITIAPDAFEDREMLEELIVLAVNDALNKARVANQDLALTLLSRLESE